MAPHLSKQRCRRRPYGASHFPRACFRQNKNRCQTLGWGWEARQQYSAVQWGVVYCRLVFPENCGRTDLMEWMYTSSPCLSARVSGFSFCTMWSCHAIQYTIYNVIQYHAILYLLTRLASPYCTAWGEGVAQLVTDANSTNSGRGWFIHLSDHINECIAAPGKASESAENEEKIYFKVWKTMA